MFDYKGTFRRVIETVLISFPLPRKIYSFIITSFFRKGVLLFTPQGFVQRENTLYQRMIPCFFPFLEEERLPREQQNEPVTILLLLTSIQTGKAKVHLDAFLAMVNLLFQGGDVANCLILVSQENKMLGQFFYKGSLSLKPNKGLEEKLSESLETSHLAIKDQVSLSIVHGTFESLEAYYREVMARIDVYQPDVVFTYTGQPNDAYLLRRWCHSHYPIMQRFTQTRHGTDDFTDVYVVQQAVGLKLKGHQKESIVPLNFSVENLIQKSAIVPEEISKRLQNRKVVLTALTGRVLRLYQKLSDEAKQAFSNLFLEQENTIWLFVGEELKEGYLNQEPTLQGLIAKEKLIILGVVDYFNNLIKASDALLHLPDFPGGGWMGRCAVELGVPIICNQYSDVQELFSNRCGVYQDDSPQEAVQLLESCLTNPTFGGELSRNQSDSMRKDYNESALLLNEARKEAIRLFERRQKRWSTVM